MTRVAALYDVHGMPDALDAALADVPEDATILLGGDLVAGPFPKETLARLRALGDRAVWIRGNSDRELLPGEASPDDPFFPTIEFVQQQLTADEIAFVNSHPSNATLDLEGVGRVLFCHATPQNDTDIVTEATPIEYLRRGLEGVDAEVVVSGHTHMQFDRSVDGIRWICAGSVGMPYEGEVAAFWALLGPGVELRRTPFDVERAAEAVLASGWPPAEEFVRENMREAMRREDVVPLFEQIAIDRGER